jgi:hypothetical protein
MLFADVFQIFRCSSTTILPKYKTFFHNLRIPSFFQNTTDCTVTKGCFLSPANCEGTSCTYIYKYSSDSNFTYFELSANVASLSKPWLAIGKNFIFI